jgi:hypothetical protein
MTGRNAAIWDSEQLKKLLVLREHARADAWLRKDRRALDALLAPEFHEINSIGRFSRDELLERLFPALILHDFTIEDPAIRITDENTAVLSSLCHEWLTVDGKQIRGTFHVFATYTSDRKQYRLSVWESWPAG